MVEFLTHPNRTTIVLAGLASMVVSSCTLTIPEGVFACANDDGCPSPLVCGEPGFCVDRARVGTHDAANVGDDAGGMPPRDAEVGTDATSYADAIVDGSRDAGADAPSGTNDAGGGPTCDVGTIDCDGRADNGCEVTALACPIPTPRAIAPLSDVVVTSRRPELRFEVPSGTEAHVQVCADPACTDVVFAATGLSPMQVGVDLAPGRYHWRAFGVRDGVAGARSSPLRRFTVFTRITPNFATSGLLYLNVSGGHDDTLVGQPAPTGGSVHVYDGDQTARVQVLDATLPGFGASVAAAGDVDGDGFGDVVIGACLADLGAFVPSSCAGAVRVHRGRADGTIDPAPFLSLDAPTGADGFGVSVASAGDFDRDGHADVVVGAHQGCRAFVYLGAPTADAVRRINLLPGGVDPGDGSACGYFGFSVASAGDFDGDGYGDVLVGRPIGTQLAYVFLGSPSRSAHGGEVVLVGPTSITTRFGATVASAGDVNADGIGDVIVGGDAGTGYAALFAGSWLHRDGSRATLPLRTYSGGTSGTAFGISAIGLGDVDGDGYSDVAIGAPSATLPTVRVYGGGGVPTAVPIVTITESMGSFGRSLGLGGLSDGDARADLVVGACGTSTTLPCGSAARLFVGLGAQTFQTHRSWTGVGPLFGAAVGR